MIPEPIRDLAVRLVPPTVPIRPVGPRPSPLLKALGRAGTTHVYADTASVEELSGVPGMETGGSLEGIDGNTINQPLAKKVLDEYVHDGEIGRWIEGLREGGEVDDEIAVHLLYTMLLARIAQRMRHRFAGGRLWAPSLQVHMSATADRSAEMELGRLSVRMAPGALVKVPFTPHAPHCFLVARDLEREGLSVNFTSTFSARQVVAAALLGNVTRTNIFMGRLNAGLSAELLGEHVDLEAQRALLRLRRERGAKTMLIVASIHDWRTFVNVAGCDVFTTPVPILRDLLGDDRCGVEEIESKLETSYEEQMTLGSKALERLGREPIARLWRVEPEFIEFLAEYGGSAEYAGTEDGDLVQARFDAAGFADFFRAPGPAEWKRLGENKVPDLDGPLVGDAALDTLYTLRAHADFVANQKQIDEVLRDELMRV